ncbi:DUF4062 domain-containing protein [Hymenobacter aerilatus]|uniref:DUF4062 domain-containing protein n=1 Tax=Hymenobacter aerilatus TaxID=2932251 RepID=A0A8T9T0K4_9BACT|nr:DUF4062 domain-containing protein [Hymenobacter aerilatus]UOR06714.1 DUF4062 domain-containing protein [Hymenobacter aerilatus]
MDTKYQVFISSTYVDLKEQREQVVKTVLRMGHLPVGMEMFDAADDSQWETIKRHINNSDYYLLIIAHRYGSEDSDGMGFTEKEYSYALEQNIPCIAFMIDNSIKDWHNDFIDSGKQKKKLDKFKARFKNKLVNFWTSKDNLALQVSHSLSTLITNNPRIGWVRANKATTSPLVAEEISRLSKENNELKILLSENNKPDEIEEVKNILLNIKYKIKYSTDHEYKTIDCLSIFILVGPGLVTEISNFHYYNHVDSIVAGIEIEDDMSNIFEENYQNEIREISISITQNLSMLDLISSRKVDKSTHWTLTTKGKLLLTRIKHGSTASTIDNNK